MIPMIDTMLATPGAAALFTMGPAFVGLVVALVAGLAWMARQTAEELRRAAARDWERRAATPPPLSPNRLAA
jgi:hypothetical protein